MSDSYLLPDRQEGRLDDQLDRGPSRESNARNASDRNDDDWAGYDGSAGYIVRRDSQDGFPVEAKTPAGSGGGTYSSENKLYYTEPGAKDRATSCNDREATVGGNDRSEANQVRPAVENNRGTTSTYTATPFDPNTSVEAPDRPATAPSQTSTTDPDPLGFDIMAPTSEHAPETRLGISDDTAPYSNSTTYGSGTTGGPGHGNKTAPDPDVDTATTRFGSAGSTAAYLGGTGYGSGTTAGPGAGNKTAATGSSDSTMGKLMEKAGEVLKKDSLVEKGQEKREAAGYGKE